MILPLVILTVVALTLVSIKMFGKVKSASLLNRVYADMVIDPPFPAESALRLRWLGIELIQNSGD